MAGVDDTNKIIKNGDQEFVTIQALHHHQLHHGDLINHKLDALSGIKYDGCLLEFMVTLKVHGTNFGVAIRMQKAMMTFGMTRLRVNGLSKNIFDFYFIEENI